jgi:hypothetical protein
MAIDDASNKGAHMLGFKLKFRHDENRIRQCLRHFLNANLSARECAFIDMAQLCRPRKMPCSDSSTALLSGLWPEQPTDDAELGLILGVRTRRHSSAM